MAERKKKTAARKVPVKDALITATVLKEWNACTDGFERFCELFPKGATLKVASEGLIADGHPDWSNWLWRACKNDKRYAEQCTATAGDEGTATAGDEGTATAGDEGTATAGDEGTATAGWKGTATAGWKGTATAGNEGTATAGDEGVLILLHFDKDKNKYVKKVALVGEGGIKPRTMYKLDDKGAFTEVGA